MIFSNTSGGVISVTSDDGSASGMYIATNTTAQVTNAAAITVTGSDSAYGISVTADGTLTNSGAVTATSTGSSVYGVQYSANTGTLTNTGVVQATTTSSESAYGISAYATVAGTLVNRGAVTATANSGDAYALGAYGSGTQTVSNYATLTAIGGDKAIGISFSAYHGGTTTNSGAITATSSGGSASGIYLNVDGGNATVTNSGNLTISGGGNNDGIFATVSGTLSITNSGALSVANLNNATTNFGINASSGGNLDITDTATGGITASRTVRSNSVGISATSSGGAVTITTGAAISASAYFNATGIVASGSSGATIGNSGSIVANSGFGTALGIGASSASGDVSIMNNHGGTVTVSSYYTSYGLQSTSTTGSATVTNAGTISDSASHSGSNSYGISAVGSTGVTITNSGSVSGYAPQGIGYGIYADPSGPLVVTNTGTVTGSTYGIYLASAGTVNDGGGVSGGTRSISVPTNSTVNLTGSGPLSGLLKGGADDTSTSLLNFALTIRTNFAAAKAALDAAIAQYEAAYTTANGNGADVTSVPVVLNSSTYQWQDFATVEDNLIQGRLYQRTPGYNGIGAAIDNFDPGSTRGTTILNALDNLPDSAVANALAQLSPKALQVFRHIAFDGASFTAANVNNHLANLRDGLTGFDTSGFSVNTPGVDPTLTQMRSRLLAFNPAPFDHGLLSDSSSSLFGGTDMKDPKAMVNTQPVDPWSAFISGSVVLANLDNTTSNIGDSDYTTGSVMAGVDYRLTDNFTVGALFNYAHTSANLDGNGSKATVDSYAPGIYASYVDKKGWYGNAMLMYGFNDNTDDRNITIPGIQGVNHGASDAARSPQT